MSCGCWVDVFIPGLSKIETFVTGNTLEVEEKTDRWLDGETDLECYKTAYKHGKGVYIADLMSIDVDDSEDSSICIKTVPIPIIGAMYPSSMVH